MNQVTLEALKKQMKEVVQRNEMNVQNTVRTTVGDIVITLRREMDARFDAQCQAYENELRNLHTPMNALH